MVDEFSERYAGLVTGCYDCVDRIVLNAYYPLGHSPGGLRTWWRALHGTDEQLDDTHLMRMAGRLARRVKAWGSANGVPVIFCKSGERKHEIAENYLATHEVTAAGVFLVLVAKAPATVWKVKRSANGLITNLEKKTEYVNHYSFHIMDPDWGHVTIKMSGHPPFAAQVILNGHEYVACQARRAGIAFGKDGNCFTAVADPAGLARVADALSQHAAVGRLGQVCDRWIYTACLCFALDSDEQRRSGFSYAYSIYQVEYSRNLLFRSGATMDRLFDAVVDRTRSRLDLPILRTLFGAKTRPHRDRTSGPPRLEVVIETPQYDLTLFKVHFGRLTLKGYTKGEHVLRFEAIVHNTKELGLGRTLDKFPVIVSRLTGMIERFCTTLDCVDIGFLPDTTLDDLPVPARVGAARVSGVDLNKPRIRNTLAAVLALSAAPNGFTVTDLAAKVRQMTAADYTTRQAAYDLRKLRGKDLVHKPGTTRRYRVPYPAARIITALLTLRDHVIGPILAGVTNPAPHPPAHSTPIDQAYDCLRTCAYRIRIDKMLAMLRRWPMPRWSKRVCMQLAQVVRGLAGGVVGCGHLAHLGGEAAFVAWSAFCGCCVFSPAAAAVDLRLDSPTPGLVLPMPKDLTLVSADRDCGSEMCSEIYLIGSPDQARLQELTDRLWTHLVATKGWERRRDDAGCQRPGWLLRNEFCLFVDVERTEPVAVLRVHVTGDLTVASPRRAAAY